MKWGLGLWALLIGVVVAYVIADAFLDISHKIRLRAWPFIRRAWGAVWGFRPGRAKTPTVAKPARGQNGGQNGEPVILSAPASDQTRPNNPIRLPSIASVFAWFWKWKAPILIVSAGLFVFGLLRGCSIPFFGPSRDTLRAQIKEAHVEAAVLEHERYMEKLGGELALETERDSARVERVIEEANQEIEDAVEADDFDRLYDAYRRAYGSVWDDLGEGRPDPDAGRAAPVRGARSHTA